ncbi:hypothetical protein AAVH_34555, partial [Aphelenchoides avenae]
MNVPLWVSPVIEIPGTAFMCLVFYFLIRQIHRRRPDFSSGFYVIFSWYCGYTLFQILLNYFTARFDMYGWVPEFYLHNHVLARACILLLTFTATYLPWAITFLAANRFVAVMMPAVYDSATSSRRGLWLSIVFNHLIALLGLLLKTPVDADYVYVDEGNMTLDLFIAKDSRSVYWMG